MKPCLNKNIVENFEGVESAAFKGEEKNQIEVTGEFDSVELASQLRRKIGYAELVTVEEKKEEKKEEPKTTVIQPVWPDTCYPSIPVYDMSSQYYPQYSNCSIL